MEIWISNKLLFYNFITFSSNKVLQIYLICKNIFLSNSSLTLEDTIHIRQFCFVTIELLTLAVSQTLIYCGQNCTTGLLYGRFHRTADLGSCTASFRSTQNLGPKSDHKTAWVNSFTDTFSGWAEN